MSKKQSVSMVLQFDTDLSDWLKSVTRREYTTRVDIIRRGLAVIIAYDLRRKQLPHLGFVSDPKKLDVEILGILNY